MPQIFISYSRKDSRFVEQLAADLKNTGYDVWYDVSGIRGGTKWRAEIEKGLSSSQFVIVVLSPDSTASEWVEREFLFASDLELKIIPLYYRQCKLPLSYLDMNYIDVRGNKYQENFREILSALDPSRIPSPPLPTKSFWEEIRKKLPVMSLALFAGSLVIGSVFLLSQDRTGADAQMHTETAMTVEAKLTSAVQTAPPFTLTTPVNNPTDMPVKECINSSLWLSLTKVSVEPDNCLSLTDWGFFAKENGFRIVKNSYSEVIRQGIFTPVSSGSQVRLRLTLSTLYTPYDNNLANLSIGIISISAHNLETDTLLIYQKESPKDGYPIFVKQTERNGFDAYLMQDGNYRRYSELTEQEILLDVSQTDLLTIYIDGVQVIQVSVPFKDKAFWVGYRLPENGQIDADISELHIQ